MDASIFIAYSHRDEELKNELRTHLSPLIRLGQAQDWHDRLIQPGDVWEKEIDHYLNSSTVILLLISADFIRSEYCYGKEMKRAIERHEAGEARVIPIILRPCDWQCLPIAKLQAVPKDGKPITLWQNQDEALTDVAKSIRSLIQTFPATNSVPAPPAAKNLDTPNHVDFSKAIDVCSTCSTVNPRRCITCKRCFNCLGERPSFWNKVAFEDAHFCSDCHPPPDGLTAS